MSRMELGQYVAQVSCRRHLVSVPTFATVAVWTRWPQALASLRTFATMASPHLIGSLLDARSPPLRERTNSPLHTSDNKSCLSPVPACTPTALVTVATTHVYSLVAAHDVSSTAASNYRVCRSSTSFTCACSPTASCTTGVGSTTLGQMHGLCSVQEGVCRGLESLTPTLHISLG
jgi:hypothetical protein